MSVILCFTAQTFITFNAPILEFTMPFFPVILHYIQFFILKLLFPSVCTFTSSRKIFSELEFSFVPVIMLSASISNFFIFKFLQLQKSISIFNFILDFKFQLQTSNLNFNFTHHLQTSTLNFSSTSYINVPLNHQTTISTCIFILQLHILTSPQLKLDLSYLSLSLLITISGLTFIALIFFIIISCNFIFCFKCYTQLLLFNSYF